MIREKRQKEASDSFHGDEWALIKAAPRFGKIKVAIDILKRLSPKKVLVCYPRVDIKEGWESDIEKWNYTGEIQYSTFRSLSKVNSQDWDMVIIDEIHECSNSQLMEIKKFKTKNLLALSGTVTATTERNIYHMTGIVPCYEYSIYQAVEEGILCDYNITIHKIPLDDVQKIKGKSEKQRFRALCKVYETCKDAKKDTFFIYLKQIQLIQASIAKKRKTRDLLEQWGSERVLVFCGTTDVADQLGVPVYHSKRRERQIFLDFCSGISTNNHLVTIKMAQAGITIHPINKGLINYTSGNPEDCAQKICRFLGIEYDNPEKRADIHLVISDEKFEIDRISTALMFFEETKIKGLKD